MDGPEDSDITPEKRSVSILDEVTNSCCSIPKLRDLFIFW